MSSWRCEKCLTVVIVAKINAAQVIPINAEKINRVSTLRTPATNSNPTAGIKPVYFPWCQSAPFGGSDWGSVSRNDFGALARKKSRPKWAAFSSD